jgi:hypothetical protein
LIPSGSKILTAARIRKATAENQMRELQLAQFNGWLVDCGYVEALRAADRRVAQTGFILWRTLLYPNNERFAIELLAALPDRRSADPLERATFLSGAAQRSAARDGLPTPPAEYQRVRGETACGAAFDAKMRPRIVSLRKRDGRRSVSGLGASPPVGTHPRRCCIRAKIVFTEKPVSGPERLVTRCRSTVNDGVKNF